MAVQTRLLEAAERRAEEGRKRLEEVEHEWEQDLERRRDAERRAEEERTEWAEERQELIDKATELRETVDRLVDARGGSSSEGSLMSPTANLARSLQRGGQSLGDLYTENVKIKNDLSRQEAETRRLESYLQEVLRDLQERVSRERALGTIIFDD